MKKQKSFRTLFEEARATDAYWVARATLEFSESMVRLLKERGWSRSELAKALGTSAAYVTKLLRGEANCTVETMVRVARALGAEFKPTLWTAAVSVSTGASARSNIAVNYVAFTNASLLAWKVFPTYSPVQETTPGSEYVSVDGLIWSEERLVAGLDYTVQ